MAFRPMHEACVAAFCSAKITHSLEQIGTVLHLKIPKPLTRKRLNDVPSASQSLSAN